MSCCIVRLDWLLIFRLLIFITAGWCSFLVWWVSLYSRHSRLWDLMPLRQTKKKINSILIEAPYLHSLYSWFDLTNHQHKININLLIVPNFLNDVFVIVMFTMAPYYSDKIWFESKWVDIGCLKISYKLRYKIY